MKKDTKKTIHLQIDEKLRSELEQEAKLKGITLSGYIRMILIERGK